MMMDRSRDSRKRIFAAAGAGALLLVVLFFSSPLAPYVRGAFASIVTHRPSSTTLAVYSGLSHDALASRLADAEKQLAQVKYQSVLYGLLADENAKLRQALKANPPAEAVLARVLSRPPETLYDTLLIDQGATAWLTKGDIVTYQNIAIGKVASAGAGSALVQLFSSPGTDQDVIVGAPVAIAVARGLGGGAFELAVPQGVVVKAGDAIKISGSEPLLLATVVSVSSKPGDASQTVRARSPVALSDLDFVEAVPSATRP